MNAQFERTTFTVSRAMEYFSQKELTMQIGSELYKWPLALLKEMIDNGLDAAERRGVSPEIAIEFDGDTMSVSDNGAGIPVETIASTLDYTTRTSSNALYVSPTRGQLGNATKCLFAAGFAADGEKGRVIVESHGIKQTIEVRLDKIKQEPSITRDLSESEVKTGTIFKIEFPQLASYLSDCENADFLLAHRLIRKYAAFNPHATFSIANRRIPATDTNFTKWTPGEATSPHWYAINDLMALIAAHISRGDNLSVRDLVAQFRGLSGSAKMKAVTDEAGLNGKKLADLVSDSEIDRQKVAALLSAMKNHSKPIKPEMLGVIGQEHFSRWLSHIREDSFRYRKATVVVDGIQYVIEMALGIATGYASRELTVGINFSALITNPLDWLEYQLSQFRVDARDPVQIVIHITTPKAVFKDRGKAHLNLPWKVRVALVDVMDKVTKDWQKAKRQADREGRVSQRDIDRAMKAEKASKLSVKAAAWRVMEQAYLKASAGGTLPANARQIMYAARPEIIELTGKSEPWTDSRIFTGKLLPEFMDANAELTANWDITFDARGHFHEPHTGTRIDLGTLGVRRYMAGWFHPRKCDLSAQIHSLSAATTNGPNGRYKNVLFIEKEGFLELIKAKRISERYDLAIMSTKGMSNTAARQLIEALAEHEVTILVAHDFDKSGFTIAHTLFNDTARYSFRKKPNVIDLGLRLSDALAMRLEAEDVTYDSERDPRELLREQGATEDEVNFLVQSGRAKDWCGQRIELNAMTADVFIDWLERGLQAAGVTKVVPDEKTVEDVFINAVIANRITAEVTRLLSDGGKFVHVPPDIYQRVQERLAEAPERSWESIVMSLASQEVVA